VSTTAQKGFQYRSVLSFQAKIARKLTKKMPQINGLRPRGALENNSTFQVRMETWYLIRKKQPMSEVKKLDSVVF